MRVHCLAGPRATCSANAHLVLGNGSAIGNVNTLVDVGRDPTVLASIRQAPTGVGKMAAEQVMLTHGHYNHVQLLGALRAAYHPEVCALRGSELADRRLSDGELVRCGDRELEVIRCTAHSSDSICLLCHEQGVLFAGDTPAKAIYFGHGPALLQGCGEVLRRTHDVVSRGCRPGRG